MAYSEIKTESYNNMMGMNSKVSSYDNNKAEFRELTNLNFQAPGALTKRPGSTLYTTGSTVTGAINSLYEFNKLNGSSYLIGSANTTAYNITTTLSPIKTGLLNNGLFDFVTFVDRLFMGNGQDFFKYDGAQTNSFGLPSGITTGGFGVTAGVGGSLTTGTTQTFVASYGYLNNRGYYGPSSGGITIVLNGATFNSLFYYGMTGPNSDYGVSAFVMYRSLAGQASQFGTTFIPAGTTFLDTSSIVGTIPANDNLNFGASYAPKFLEIYNNQVFYGGFSSIPSTFFYSNIAEPEGIAPESFEEVRTNDGDILTGFKSYRNSFVIFKNKSVSILSGEDPTNFSLQLVTDQYGCISNRAIVVFEDFLWFLDEKGICQYNGAGTSVISDKMEPIFLRMNISAAKQKAWGIYYKDLDEVWFGIPVDGSDKVNLVVVYDVNVKAWTKYEGIDLASVALATGRLDRRTVFFGGYTGSAFAFGSSYLNDFGKDGITCLFQTPYYAPSGHSTTRQFRRYYLDIDPIIGSSTSVYLNFVSNFGLTSGFTASIYQNQYQTRVDFGIPAKSLSVIGSYFSSTLSLKINGYAFDTRYQRSV